MKATRKLIPAIAMLLISAVMMSTATFAWFSTNSTVTADKISISAKSENAFIVISKDAYSAGVATVTPKVEMNAEGSVIPATAFTTTASGTTPGSKSAGASIHWYTATAEKAENSAINTDGYVPATNLSLYTVSDTFYIRSAQGFPTAKNLRLSGCWVTGTSDFTAAVSVVLEVTIGEEVKYYIYEGENRGVKDDEGNITSEAADDIIAANVYSDADVKVKFYVYINGDNGEVYTNNADVVNLSDMNVVLTFDVDGIA